MRVAPEIDRKLGPKESEQLVMAFSGRIVATYIANTATYIDLI